ncbi:hypothetical protein ACLOJK_022804, partial [Asimina triloba]
MDRLTPPRKVGDEAPNIGQLPLQAPQLLGVAWRRHSLDCLSFERINLDAPMSDNKAEELAG